LSSSSVTNTFSARKFAADNITPMANFIELSLLRIKRASYFAESILDSFDVSAHFDVENGLHELEWLELDLLELQKQFKLMKDRLNLQIEHFEVQKSQLEFRLSLSSFVVAFGALVTGIFGMNLLSHFEYHDNAFYIVTLFIASLMTLLFRIFSIRVKPYNLFP
jgi:hypothetical protein